jgi:4-hydroxybenzoate polyprenyltransferase
MGENTKNLPLCVDLDYTLISSDIIIEQIVTLIKQSPIYIFQILLWYLFGKTHLKKKLSEKVNLDVKLLPYRNEVIRFLKTEKEKGRPLILVTATLQDVAEKINHHLNLFDDVYGSNQKFNLKGKNKAKFLAEKFGVKNFDYIGDSFADVSIWKIANKAYAITNSRTVLFRLKHLSSFVTNFAERATSFSDFLKLIRVHQWLKNLLVFIPLLLAHKFDHTAIWISATVAFLSFSFGASSLYIVNDILDIKSDRNHPEKSKRPITNGMISAYTGLFISTLLFLLSFIIGLNLGLIFVAVLLVYIFANLLYSLYLKQVPIWDIFILSTLYVIRLYAGSVSTGITISNWLLAFSLFFFLSLAGLKRFTELSLISDKDIETLGRPYKSDSISIIQNIGLNSSFASIIIFILYINSEKVLQLYKSPELLWFDAFLLLLWNINLWFLSSKGKAEFDPILTSVKNPFSLFLILLIIAIWLMATLL